MPTHFPVTSQLIKMIKNFLIVAAGGGLGAVLRFGSSELIRTGNFPAATLLINMTGSFAIGIIMALHLKMTGGINEQWKLFLATGICGGFTTFSAFSYENLQLLQSGKFNTAFAYIISSVLLGLLAVYTGFKLFNT